MPETIIVVTIVAFVAIILSTAAFFASRYKRCPSDMVLVIYGKVGTGQSSRCIHGGGAFVWPLIQECRFLSLTPMTIAIDLKNALSKQNIRIDVPSTFTVGISTDMGVMNNAAERMLGLTPREIEEMSREIIFGQLRLTVASLTIEEINQDRERFLESIRENVEPELNKIGLYLINVNITDITDESDYIESIGKKAASTAINQAKIDVAEQERHGAMGESEAVRDKEIRVAENVAASEKGQKKANADQRVYVQQQEAEAVKGEKQAVSEQRVFVQQQEAAAIKGEKEAEAGQRIFVQEQEASAITGENLAKANIANSDAELDVKRAEAHQRGEVAKRMAEVEIQKAEAQAEMERLNAEKVVQQEIAKRMTEIAADATAEKTRREAKGDADAILMKYEAEASGVQKVLEAKANGYQSLVAGAGDAQAVATLLMVEKIEDVVGKQVEAIKNLKIDKITVWDSGASTGGQGSSTANFISNFVKSLPPLQEITRQAGVELPDYLGRMVDDAAAAPVETTDDAPMA